MLSSTCLREDGATETNETLEQAHYDSPVTLEVPHAAAQGVEQQGGKGW